MSFAPLAPLPPAPSLRPTPLDFTNPPAVTMLATFPNSPDIAAIANYAADAAAIANFSAAPAGAAVWSYNHLGLAFNGFLRETPLELKRITRQEAEISLATMPARNWAEAQLRLYGVVPGLPDRVQQLRRMAAQDRSLERPARVQADLEAKYIARVALWEQIQANPATAMRQASADPGEHGEFRRFVETWQAETHPVDYLQEVWQLHVEQGFPADGPAHAVENVSAAALGPLHAAKTQLGLEEVLFVLEISGIVYVVGLHAMLGRDAPSAAFQKALDLASGFPTVQPGPPQQPEPGQSDEEYWTQRYWENSVDVHLRNPSWKGPVPGEPLPQKPRRQRKSRAKGNVASQSDSRASRRRHSSGTSPASAVEPRAAGPFGAQGQVSPMHVSRGYLGPLAEAGEPSHGRATGTHVPPFSPAAIPAPMFLDPPIPAPPILTPAAPVQSEPPTDVELPGGDYAGHTVEIRKGGGVWTCVWEPSIT